MSTLRILLAEDNQLNQKVVVRMLQKLGQDADIASNGHEAVSLAQKSRYDVIFMDLMMPQLDGFEAAKRIRGLESEDHRSLIIALTANTMGSDRSRCLEAGMDDFMMKPFMLGTLKEKLDSIMEARPIPTPCPTDTLLLQEDDLVDRSVLRSLASMVDENDSGYLKELLSDYLTDAERLRGEIYESIQSANLQSLRQASHSLKSTSAMFGALRLSSLCADFERSAIEQNLPAVQTRLAEFDETLEAVHAALVELVDAEAY